MNEQKKLVPKLRFPTFGQSWERTPLGELGKFFRGLTYGAHDVGSSGLLVLRSSNIQGGKLILDSDLVFVTKQCPPELCLKRGDIAICMSNGSKALVGKSGEFDKDYPGELTVGAFCSIFRPTTTFAKIAFSTPRYDSFVATGIAGGNINNLKNSDLESFEFHVPPSSSEQQKIADCLSSLDELIAAQDRKVATLKTHKKGLMQQLFPREGETQPRLRFPEFQKGVGWKMKKINKMLVDTPRPIEMNDETQYSLVTVKRRYGGVVSRELLTGKNIKVKSQFLVEADDFLISKRQIVHNACGLVPVNLKGCIVSNEYSVLTAIEGCDIRFFNYFAQQPSVSESFLQASVGIVIEKMLFKLDSWFKREFLFPLYEEQQRIADCLLNLDTLITVATQELEALRAHKKGLMQQLFPSAELSA